MFSYVSPDSSYTIADFGKSDVPGPAESWSAFQASPAHSVVEEPVMAQVNPNLQKVRSRYWYFQNNCRLESLDRFKYMIRREIFRVLISFIMVMHCNGVAHR